MIERWRLYIAHHRRHRHPHQHHHNNTTTPATILMKDIPLHRLVDTVIKRERTRERFAVVVCLFALARSHPISSHLPVVVVGGSKSRIEYLDHLDTRSERMIGYWTTLAQL